MVADDSRSRQYHVAHVSCWVAVARIQVGCPCGARWIRFIKMKEDCRYTHCEPGFLATPNLPETNQNAFEKSPF